MSWLTAYWLTVALMFGATAGVLVWIVWLRRQPPTRRRRASFMAERDQPLAQEREPLDKAQEPRHTSASD